MIGEARAGAMIGNRPMVGNPSQPPMIAWGSETAPSLPDAFGEKDRQHRSVLGARTSPREPDRSAVATMAVDHRAKAGEIERQRLLKRKRAARRGIAWLSASTLLKRLVEPSVESEIGLGSTFILWGAPDAVESGMTPRPSTAGVGCLAQRRFTSSSPAGQGFPKDGGGYTSWVTVK